MLSAVRELPARFDLQGAPVRGGRRPTAPRLPSRAPGGRAGPRRPGPAAAPPACGTAPDGTQLDCVGPTGGPGKCLAEVTQAGHACDPTLQTGAGCATYLSLVCDSTTKQCVPIPVLPPGASCAQGGQCGAGSRCDGKTCVPPRAIGAACQVGEGPSCAARSTCVAAASDGGTGAAGVCKAVSSTTACN